MTEPKARRQGQKKPDGKKAIPKPICPKCNEYMKRYYTREEVNGKRQYVPAGWTCPSVTCDCIIKDLVVIETEDETEPINEIEND
ncbi:MAG: hypothetical protein ACP5N0_10180 [Methanosarcina sp.]|uniref:hypothetical protein n=1 Tax=Methanosarcina sp. TaxID=2213 RepID=UPI003BB5D98A